MLLVHHLLKNHWSRVVHQQMVHQQHKGAEFNLTPSVLARQHAWGIAVQFASAKVFYGVSKAFPSHQAAAELRYLGCVRWSVCTNPC
jgi:hypothetical protein